MLARLLGRGVGTQVLRAVLVPLLQRSTRLRVSSASPSEILVLHPQEDPRVLPDSPSSAGSSC